MRTGSVLVVGDPVRMQNHALTDALVHDRQRELGRTAAPARRQRRVRAAPPAPVRTRAGWVLIRAGARLARADVVHQAAAGPPLLRPG
jgi:hypothetical protein